MIILFTFWYILGWQFPVWLWVVSGIMFLASFSGKIELETFEEGRESKVTDALTRRAVLRVFDSYFDIEELESVVTAFDLGERVEISSEKRASEYPALVDKVDGIAEVVKKLPDDLRPVVVASAVEFVLEGLHLNRRLNCERSDDGAGCAALVCV